MTVSILVGDVRDKLRSLPADSFDCVVTSPPYWGLRNYGVAGQIGLEPTLGEHLAVMVDVFREVRRVLKPSGVLFLNYGDCYATTPNGRSAADIKAKGTDDRTFRDKPFSTIGGTLKAKDLAMVPNRLAIALQEPFHTGPIRQEIDRAWLAGLIDADGCIGIRRQDNGKWNSTYIPYLTVGCSDIALVERCASITGLGKVNLKSHAGDTDARGIKQRRDGYVWRLDGQIASEVIRDIFPYLVQKGPQARLASAMNESQGEPRPTRGQPVHPDIVAYRARLYECIKATNQRRDVDLPKLPPVRSSFEQGWWVRSEIIWGKPNPMPESIKDRPATSHEKIFMLTKSARYFYAADNVRQGRADDEDTFRPDRYGRAREASPMDGRRALTPAERQETRNGRQAAIAAHAVGSSVSDLASPHAKVLRKRGRPNGAATFEKFGHNTSAGSAPDGSRSLRNWEPAPPAVWIMGTSPFSEAHFATFPPELVERCLKAGCPKGGTVLDPFGGAGTTALVADQMQLDATIIELNPDYVHIAVRRIEADRGEIQNVLDPLQVDLLQGAA